MVILLSCCLRPLELLRARVKDEPAVQACGSSVVSLLLRPQDTGGKTMKRIAPTRLMLKTMK